MPAKIRLLSEDTINQIAAGEIIENPASALKELIENSLDAGARRIEVEVHGGGHLFFEVRDDGTGMGRDDAIFCLERHATSKIRKFADLLELTSMGFRGEALASIAAVSKMEIETCDEEGTKVICHGGKIVKVEGCLRNRGTTIRVSSLFYNVPARKKFQKSASQETANISKMLSKVALAHPEVSFQLTSQGNKLLTTSKKKEQRIEEVLGKEFLVDTKEILLERDGYTIRGIVGSPMNVKSNRMHQYLLINKRPVVSQLVERAVQSGFGTRIGNRQYPVFVLWMEVPPERLDVNVHPQKSVVRFAEEEKVHHFVKSAIEESFSVVIPKIETPLSKVPYFVEVKEEYKPTFEIKQEEALIREEIEVMGFFKEVAVVKIAQVPPWFIEEQMIFVDLPKLDAKVQFHRLLEKLQGAGEEMQQLLFPEVLKISDGELVLKYQDLLTKVGIGIRPFGKGTFTVDTLSPLFSLDHVEKVIHLLLTEFRKEFTLESIAKAVLSVRPSRFYSREEVKHLILKVLKLEEPFYAPNGGRIMVPFNKEKTFD